MREIKFMAWDKFNGMMLLPVDANGKEKSLWWFFSQYDELVKGENNPVLMQFTGLSDKNGKEIYEGDICQLENASGLFKGMSYKVVFCEGAFCLEPIGFDMTGHEPASFIYTNDRLQETGKGRNISKYIKVISNLYENPNLLEK